MIYLHKTAQMLNVQPDDVKQMAIPMKPVPCHDIKKIPVVQFPCAHFQPTNITTTLISITID